MQIPLFYYEKEIFHTDISKLQMITDISLYTELQFSLILIYKFMAKPI